jgi:hypothetical protein
MGGRIDDITCVDNTVYLLRRICHGRRLENQQPGTTFTPVFDAAPPPTAAPPYQTKSERARAKPTIIKAPALATASINQPIGETF